MKKLTKYEKELIRFYKKVSKANDNLSSLGREIFLTIYKKDCEDFIINLFEKNKNKKFTSLEIAKYFYIDLTGKGSDLEDNFDMYKYENYIEIEALVRSVVMDLQEKNKIDFVLEEMKEKSKRGFFKYKKL